MQSEARVRMAAGTGFDGIDITVREGVHVEPSRVRQEPTRLVRAIRAGNQEVRVVTTPGRQTHGIFRVQASRRCLISGCHYTDSPVAEHRRQYIYL